MMEVKNTEKKKNQLEWQNALSDVAATCETKSDKEAWVDFVGIGNKAIIFFSSALKLEGH